MRLLLSSDSNKKLFDFLIKTNHCNSLKELACKMKIHFRTVQKWRYSENYIPEKIIPSEIKNNLKITDRQEDNWGRVKGGKITHKIILQKYGKIEIKKRQIRGGEKSIKEKIKKQNQIILDIANPIFLEFYGVLLGDGWLGKWNYKGRTVTWIGISGSAKLDREFFNYLKRNIKILFDREAYLKERPKHNSIELIFSHRALLQKIHEELIFPIGTKSNLKIAEKIYNLGYEKVKYIIRGLFDTDGCFYTDKTPAGKPYPCIMIKMKAPVLINQIYCILINENFKVRYKKTPEGLYRIDLRGRKQLNKWMKEIGSSNPRNLDKITALVAQLDSAKGS